MLSNRTTPIKFLQYVDCRYRRAAEAWDAGYFRPEIAPVTVKSKKGEIQVFEDEEYKGLKLEKVPTLKPAFKYFPPSSPSPQFPSM